MKLWVDQEALSRALKRATLSSGAALNPIHALVKLEAKRGVKNEPDALVLSGTSGLMAINTSVQAKVDEPGVIASSIRDLTNAAGAMPMGGVSMQVAGNRLKLQGSSGRKWSGATANPDQIQIVPEPVGLPWLRVSTEAARLGMERVGYATANMDDRCRAFDGVRFEGSAGKLVTVCVSTYQCVSFEQAAAVETKHAGWQACIPTNSLSHFRELLDEAEGQEQKFLDLYEDKHFVYFVGPSTLLVAALPMGDFYPPYDLMLSNFPKEPFCTLPRLALIESIRACLMTRSSKLEPGGLFCLKDGTVTLSRNDAESDFSDTLPLVTCRQDLDLTFKAGLSLMLDLLKAADSDPELVAGADARSILARTSGGYRAMLTLMNIDAPPEQKP